MRSVIINKIGVHKLLKRPIISGLSTLVLISYTAILNPTIAETQNSVTRSYSNSQSKNKLVTPPLLYSNKNGMLIQTSEPRQKRHYSRGRKGLIYGGKDHNKFLGCIGCGKHNSNSICNPYGTYGSKYNSTSLFNKYSNFGSRYSRASPWNLYNSSDSAPILVDVQGRFYGYFTSNPYRSQAFSYARDLKKWYNDSDGDLETFQKKLCAVLG